MGTIWGYTRVSTEKQDYERQKLEILEYANLQGWKIDRFLQSKASSRKSEKERGVDVLKEAAERGDVEVIVFSELSRLGRSVGEICRLINHLVDDCGVALHFLKERLELQKGKRDIASKVMLTQFSLLAEIERDLISERTKSALAARKAQGVKLGRPAGHSKLDQHTEQIREWVELGVTNKSIARNLNCAANTLSIWLKRKEWKNGDSA